MGNDTTVLVPFSDSFSGRDLSLTVSSRMEIAEQKDSVVESEGFHVVKRATRLLSKYKDTGPTMTINFVLLRSPLLASRDPDAVIVTREPDLYGGSSSIIIYSCIRGVQYQSLPSGNSLELQPLPGWRTCHPRAEPSLLSGFARR